MGEQSNSEEAFSKALAAENAGDARKAEMWLKLAVKREDAEREASTSKKAA
jgi:hypothetical protein